VHARSVVGVGVDEVTGEVLRRRLCPAPEEVLGWVRSLPGPVKVVYEAGPTGYGLYRALEAAGVLCVVAAPSKLQRPAGDRVQTDYRDAAHLAKLLRLGEVTEVAVPSVEREAARDLVRAFEHARGDVMRSRHRVSKLLLRQGIVYSGGQPWNGVHDAWLRRQRFEQAPLQAAYESAYEAMAMAVARRERLETAIAVMAADSPYTPVVRRLGCLRPIAEVTGFALAVEIGDWTRFTGSSIGSYVGLVPSEHSSGESRAQGAITKTGNGHVRRLLVESAWHHRKPYRGPGRVLQRRWDKAPAPARARGHAGNRRLHHRWEQFAARRKRTVIADVAVARELAGWCWSLAVIDD